jgi:hypothetical protein
MAKFGRGARQVLFEFLIHGAFGVGLGIAGSAVVEIGRIPILNDTGTFGNPHMSNFEYLGYAIGSFGTVAGLASLGLKGRNLWGFSARGMPFTAGFAAGIYLYEHTIVRVLNIRKFDPYELFGHLVPPVMPHHRPGPLHPSLPG